MNRDPEVAFSLSVVSRFYAAIWEQAAESRPVAALTYRLASEAAATLSDEYEEAWFRLEMGDA